MLLPLVVLKIAPMDGGKIRTWLLLLLSCFLRDSTAQGQYRMFLRHLTAQPPTPSSVPGGFRPGFWRIVLSVGLGVLTGLIGALLFACLVRSFVHYMSRTPVLRGPVVFSPRISPKTLRTALEDESDPLGSSTGGRYRRAVLDNGLTVAVKSVELVDAGSPDKRQRKSVGRRVQKELEVLAGLRHANLMSLRAYLCETEQNRVLLVYDYMANGSLEDTMKRVREGGLELGWESRLRVAVGVIKGLQYLHFGCYPQVLHYNVKPSNVMLDAEYRARLADCGLAKIARDSSRTAGYSAPECLQNSR
ncbi:hypothetical protein MLD38_011838 [Melastoma candidum]|nr:hypothetical protein MLD38_011838 [Melastoma candidum]